MHALLDDSVNRLLDGRATAPARALGAQRVSIPAAGYAAQPYRRVLPRRLPAREVGLGIELIGAFESTYLPAHDRDVLETTGHAPARAAEDLALLGASGVRRLRYPIRWHRVEPEPGIYDWAETDALLELFSALGFQVIVDLVHHTSYPRWLEQGFADARFPSAYLAYCEAVALRYPGIREYTLFNEPFATLFLCGHEAIWPPYRRGLPAFVALLRNVLPAIGEAVRMYRELLPSARHVYTDSAERHSCDGSIAGAAYAALANDRRFFILDALLGRPIDPSRPFVADVLAAGGEDLLELNPMPVDVLGLDYYAHCQWHFTERQGYVPTPSPCPLSELITEYSLRYGLPCMLTETNIRGFASDRASWLKHTLEQCELARSQGVPLDGYCWFPFIDSCDWDSLLFRCEGSVDPVGVYWLDEHLRRRPSSMSQAFALAASGAPSSALPAYRFRPPVIDWLTGFLPFMSHWDWRPPPFDEQCSNRTPPNDRIELRIRDART